MCRIADLLADLGVDAVRGEVAGDADGVLDRLGVRAAVGDDAAAFDAEERRAAVFGVVDPLLDVVERALRAAARRSCAWTSRVTSVADASCRTISPSDSEALSTTLPMKPSQTIDVRVAVEDVAALGVAHEVEARLLEDAERLLRQLVALALFLADREQADARRVDAEDHLRVEVAHDRELAEVGGLGVDVRADVEQDGVAFARSEATAASAGRLTPSIVPMTLYAEVMAAPVCPAETIAVGLPLGDEVRADADGRVALPAQRRQSVVGHVDDFAGVDDLDARQERRRRASRGALLRGRRAVISTVGYSSTREQRALDDLVRRVVAAHRIERDPAASPCHQREGLQRRPWWR